MAIAKAILILVLTASVVRAAEPIGAASLPEQQSALESISKQPFNFIISGGDQRPVMVINPNARTIEVPPDVDVNDAARKVLLAMCSMLHWGPDCLTREANPGVKF